MAAGDKPIAESSCGPARPAAMAGDFKVDLTDEAPSRAVDHSASPPLTQCSRNARAPYPQEG